MISRKLSFIAVVTIVLLAACGKKAPSYTKYIPKGSPNVISIDVKSMLTKLNSDSLTVENMLSVIKDTANPDEYVMAMTKYKELKDAGIDWESKVYIATSAMDIMGYNKPDVEIVAATKDAAKLEDYLKKQPGMSEIKKGDGYSYGSNEDMAIGWNSEAVMMVFSGNKKRFNTFQDDDNSDKSKPKSEATLSGAAGKIKTYFALSKSESILSVDGFNDVQGKPADIAIFNQANLDGINAMAFAFLPKLKELIEGTYSATTINFENGKAVIETKGAVGKKMGEILKKYAGPEVDLSMIENYPSQNIDGAVVFSFKPELIPAIIRETGVDALLSLGLAQTGMGLDDFSKVFKGDFAVVVSDFAVNREEAGKDAEIYSREKPVAKMIFAAKIGDKAAFDKLVNFAVKTGSVIRSGDMLIPAEDGHPAPEMPFAISTANNMLTFASDSATLVAYQSKSQKAGIPDDIKSKLKGSAVGAFINIEKILQGISTEIFDSSDMAPKNILAKAKTTFKSGWITSANFDGKAVTGKGELLFADATKNSLVQLVRFSMYATEETRAESERNRKKWDEESKTTVTVTDAVPPPPPPPAPAPKRK